LAVYLPPHFDHKDPDLARELVRQHPLASLISNDDEGLPFVTHLPLHLAAVDPDGDAQAPWKLLGHVAKPNPHNRYLKARPRAKVTFLGPHAYMSPAVYPDLARVPTWNYLALHAVVRAEFVDLSGDKDRLLKHLIGDHEPAYAAQWRALGEEFAEKMMAGIVAFELHVETWQCKVKLNQHRREAHQAMHERYSVGNPNEQQLAQWMQRLGLAAE
jgi:transcriptional regulator